MADRDNSKYFYLRLKEDFFESDELVYLESLPDGILYSNILLKLYLRSLKTDGRLMLRDRIPYNPLMLANILRQPVGVVEKAIKTLSEIGLIEILDNGAIYMVDIQNFIGKSSTEADRKRDYRQRIESERASILKIEDKSPDKCPTNVGTMSTISRDISKSKDIYISSSSYSPSSSRCDDDDDEWKTIISLWNSNIMPITPLVGEKLKALSDEVGYAAMEQAITKAVEHGARNFAYVQACARNIAAGNDKPEKKELLF
jgi:predicted phage replisome organizer